MFYYTPRGKVLFDIQDLAGLNRVTKHLYDGLDRLSATTFPEGNSLAYTYDGASNPWAHNIASITRNPKPGSPLAATTISISGSAIIHPGIGNISEAAASRFGLSIMRVNPETIILRGAVR